MSCKVSLFRHNARVLMISMNVRIIIKIPVRNIRKAWRNSAFRFRNLPPFRLCVFMITLLSLHSGLATGVGCGCYGDALSGFPPADSNFALVHDNTNTHYFIKAFIRSTICFKQFL